MVNWLALALSRHVRFSIALACGLAALLAGRMAGLPVALLAAGDVFYIVFLTLCLAMIAGQSAQDLKRRAKTEDEGIAIVILIILATLLFFSFAVGRTAQVSDVVVKTTTMRRTVLWHGVGSFFFNTVFIAMAVNAAGAM